MIYIPVWHRPSWVKIAILLGYIGILIFMVYILKIHYFVKSGEAKYVSLSELKNLKKKKKLLCSAGLLAVILYIGGIGGIWVFQKSVDYELIHVLILSISYMTLDYLNITLKEKTYRISSQLEHPKKYEQIEYNSSGKKLLYVNAVVLLIFCVLYTQYTSFPFYGIWGIIAWTGTLLFSYVPCLVSVEPYSRELDIFQGKKKYVFIIFLSWVFVIFWVGLGMSIS
ncbi:MAG: hypothetical protein PVF58_14435 [Candidatus Methanofastidiosia archaeon]|jgi:hypothetical protein